MFSLTKFKDLLNSFKREKLLNQEYEEEPSLDELKKPIRREIKKTSKNGNSLLKSELPPILGVNKKKLGVLGVLFFLLFFLSFFLKNNNSSKPTIGTNIENAMTENAEINNPNVKKLPKSYDELGKLNDRQKAINNPNNPAMPQNPPIDQNPYLYGSGNGQQRYYEQPQAPMSHGGGYQNGGQMYGFYPPQYQDPSQQKNQVEKEEAKRRSIGFGISSAIIEATNNTTGSNAQSGPANYAEPQPYVLQQGSIIPVTLLTGINSDAAGQVVAQVRENVYDSVSGDYLLIPQGSRILGKVDSGAAGVGQERIRVSWQRMFLPNGVSVDLGSMDGVDTEGYPGLHDRVNNHTRKIMGATLLSGMLSAAAQIAAGNTNSDSSNESAGQLAVSGAAASMISAGTKLIERQINVNPTITISPGIHFNIFVNQDVILRPYNG